MIPTNQLIDGLAARGGVAPPLRPPVLRAAGWLSLVAGALVVLSVARPVRDDLGEMLAQPYYVACVLAALATGALSALAAFLVSVPDRSRRWMYLPAPALAIWLVAVFAGAARHWLTLTDGGIPRGEWIAAVAIVGLIGAPLCMSLMLMVRYAQVSRPLPVALLAGLAVGAIVAASLCVFVSVQGAVLGIAANAGTAILFVSAGAAFGPRLFRRMARVPGLS